MKRNLLLAIGIALAMIAVGAVGCEGYFGAGDAEIAKNISSQQNIGIWVTGEGKVNVVPDIAMLSLGIEAQATSVAEAQQEAAEAMDAVMNVIDGYGIDEKDIQTQFFSIQPVRRWDNGDNGKEILIGYRVTNIVTVKVRNIDDAGSIIDAAVAAGGDNTRVNSISFTVDEPEAYYGEAREEAMADAEAKAKQLADLGGVKLGKPNYISEYGGYISPPIIYRDFEVSEALPAPTTAISPGETEIQLTIQVVYSIS